LKKIILIETAKELIDFANPKRQEGDKMPYLGSDAKLVFKNNMGYIELQGAENIELSSKISFDDIFREMAKRLHLNIHIT
jgi:hypothetical protein